MKILAIGDPHGDLKKIREIPTKGVDLILVTGDLGAASLMRKMAFENIERRRQGKPEKEYTPQQEKKAFMEAYTTSMRVMRHLARFAPVFTIYGNVESSNEATRRFSREIGLPLPFLTNDLLSIPGVSIINNRVRNVNGVRIGGLEYFVDTNWVQEFKPSDYRDRMRSAKKQTDKARRVLRWFGDVDVLVHHQPPYRVLDKVGPMAPKVWHGKPAGSKLIRRYIERRQPAYAFCGHIHEGEGHKKIGKTNVYNLGVCGHVIVEI